jgi:hypothetical protein
MGAFSLSNSFSSFDHSKEASGNATTVWHQHSKSYKFTAFMPSFQPSWANHGKEQLSSMSEEPLFCTLPFKRCCTKQGEGGTGENALARAYTMTGEVVLKIIAKSVSAPPFERYKSRFDSGPGTLGEFVSKLNKMDSSSCYY